MSLSVTILGSNSATPTSERFSSAQVVQAGHEWLLLDCAEGTQIQLRRNKISLLKIKHIFISHLHGDHFFGLIGLLTTVHLLGQKETVTVFGPELLRSVIEYQLEVTETTLRYPLNFIAIDPAKFKIIFQNKELSVTSVPLQHGIPCCGFLIREKESLRHVRKDLGLEKTIPLEAFKALQAGKDVINMKGELILNQEVTLPGKSSVSYAYCTDTAFHESLSDLIKDVTCLFHEATFMEKELHLAREKQHSTARDAARIARLACAKKLIIGHFSARYKNLSELLQEARDIFPSTDLAEDSKTFLIDNTL
ncbi:MAG: ribonuclease Z [Bacteroidota bacterium]